MSNIVANAFLLMMLILVVNAHEKLELKTGPKPDNEDSRQHVHVSIKSDSENSAKPELSIIQKPMLLKSVAKSESEENPIEHIKLLPVSKDVSEHDSARHKVIGANDSTHNEALSNGIVLSLQNDTTLATDGTIRNLTNAHSNKPISKEKDENTSPATHPPELSIMISETDGENSPNGIEEVTIDPIESEIITDIITSILVDSTESYATDAYPEDVVVLVEDKDGLEIITEQPEQPETTTDLFAQTVIEPLLEAVTLVGNVDLDVEVTTIPSKTTSWPIDNFDFLVYDEQSHIPCILLSMNAALSITYETKDQKHATTNYKVPDELIVSGHCGDQNSSMTLSWVKTPTITKTNRITFNFSKDKSYFYLNSIHIDIVLDSHDFPNARTQDSFITGNSSLNLKLFSAPGQNGIYICPKETTVTCGNIVATISNVTVIAFNKNQELTGRKEEHCRIVKSEPTNEVNVAGIIGGVLGAGITLAIIGALFSYYRRRRDMTLRFE